MMFFSVVGGVRGVPESLQIVPAGNIVPPPVEELDEEVVAVPVVVVVVIDPVVAVPVVDVVIDAPVVVVVVGEVPPVLADVVVEALPPLEVVDPPVLQDTDISAAAGPTTRAKRANERVFTPTFFRIN